MFTLNCKGRLLVVDKPIVMGIINVTPDSFYSGSRQQSVDEVLRQAEQMLKDGAVILDMGGQSTRPGSQRLTADEELERVMAPLEQARKRFPGAYISIDTYLSKVAAEAVAAGADIVNDISAGTMDADMIATVAGLHVPYVLMHMQGTPETMQSAPHYDDVTKEVLDFFIFKVKELEKAGIRDIIIDPGFGFGKTIEHNFKLLHDLRVLQLPGKPVLAGLSRKATVYKTLGIAAEEALNGTTVLNTVSLLNGAVILRVHDVKEAKQAITLVNNMY